ncbi:hypothetical protein D3C78_1192490 [compost metagenome]
MVLCPRMVMVGSPKAERLITRPLVAFSSFENTSVATTLSSSFSSTLAKDPVALSFGSCWYPVDTTTSFSVLTFGVKVIVKLDFKGTLTVISLVKKPMNEMRSV